MNEYLICKQCNIPYLSTPLDYENGYCNKCGHERHMAEEFNQWWGDNYKDNYIQAAIRVLEGLCSFEEAWRNHNREERANIACNQADALMGELWLRLKGKQ